MLMNIKKFPFKKRQIQFHWLVSIYQTFLHLPHEEEWLTSFLYEI